METMKCSELGIEFTLEQEQNGKKFLEIKIPEGWKIFDIPLFTALWSIKKYRNAILKVNKNKLWIFLENFDYLKNEYIARFRADSDWAILYCNRNPLNSDASLGVIFWRKLK